MTASAAVAFSPIREHEHRTFTRLGHHLGSEVVALLADPSLIELSANPDGSLWADRIGQNGMARSGFLDPHRCELFINSVASSLGLVIDRNVSPVLSGELPPAPPWRGARFQAMLPPAVQSPAFSIRMHATGIFSLAEYEARGIMTTVQRAAIEAAATARLNLLVAGATVSGKSTLLNAILAHIASATPSDRVAVLEDTCELQVSSANRVQLHTTGGLTMNDLLATCMRLRPDRILIGEVKDKAALSFVKSLGTGHSGACTIHAGSAYGALRRLEDLIQEASVTPQRRQIAEAIDMIIVIRRDPRHPAGRVVKEVSELSSELSPSGEYVLTTIIGD